jgi:glycosyltransferase involved in cell wall biosynthesis
MRYEAIQDQSTEPGSRKLASVALVHDYLLVMRGAERTFATMAAQWPSAPIYTLLYGRMSSCSSFAGRDIRTSYLQRTGLGQKGFRALLPLFANAVERLDVSSYDLVLSSSSAFAHGVIANPRATHIVYCHSPFRYAWHDRVSALAEFPRPLRPLLARSLEAVRRWDVSAASRPTHYIANSEITRQRIADFYGRHSRVVHPPVQVERFEIGQPEDFLLFVGELVRHKGVEVALQAARTANLPIKVVGDGPELRRLATTYDRATEFLGRVSDSELAQLYSRARAVVVPSVEEFGITAVEAQAAGRPVVCFNRGGSKETVVANKTGLLVEPYSVDALAEALRYTDFKRFRPEQLAQHARQFSTEAFCDKLKATVSELEASCHAA